jgi:hypothetical protein
MLLDQTGAKHSQSPVEAEGGAVMVGTKFLLCPGVDINRISLCKAFVRMSAAGQTRPSDRKRATSVHALRADLR